MFLSLPSHLLFFHTGCAVAASHFHISVRNDASRACSRAKIKCLSAFYCAAPHVIALLRMRVSLLRKRGECEAWCYEKSRKKTRTTAGVRCQKKDDREKDKGSEMKDRIKKKMYT